MEKNMENYKEKGRLSRRFSSRKKLGSLKTRFKRFLSDHHAKAGAADDISSNASSDTDTDGRKTSSPLRDKSGEIKKSSGSGDSSSDSDEESPSKLVKKRKSDSSSDSSGEKKQEMRPSKSSRKKLQLHLQHEREELFKLPALEETPPTSPRSNPRFSTGALSDYGRLWTHSSAPNSPANLAHNLNISYRGGDSSPVALVHSLSVRERGKHPSQLSEISYASPPSTSGLDLDVLGEKLEDMKASPSKTTPSLQPNGLPIVHHDEEQGVWRCGSCGWIYPNPNPSLRNRREHKKHCGEISNVQRWLGAQGKGPVELAEDSEDSEVWEGSGLQETLSTADEHPVGKFEEKGNNEGASARPAYQTGSVDHGTVGEMESNDLPDHGAVGNEGNGGRSPSAVANPDKVEDQKSNRVPEWPNLDAETKDQSTADEILSTGSSNHHEVEDPSKSENVSNKSASHYGNEEVSTLDDSASLLTSEGENEKKEPVDIMTDREEVLGSVEPSQMFGREFEAHGSQLNQKSQEEMEIEAGHVEVQPLNGNRKHSLAVVQPSGHDFVHVDNDASFKEEDESANQDFNDHLNHPDDIGLTDVPELHSEQSVLTNAIGVGGGHGIDDLSTTDELDNEKPGDGFSEAAAVKSSENTEPTVIAHKGRPIVLADVVRESGVMEPSLSRADLRSVETEIEKKDVKALKAVAREGTKSGKVIPKLTEPSHSQNRSLDTENDVRTNDIKISDHRSKQKVPESYSVEGNTRVSPSQENGIRTEIGERVGGPPSPLEEAPKWVNSVMITSHDERDTFTSAQKYWADVTRSEYLLVEGKRSPSFGSCDNIGFSSFRNGEGRRSPSPFSLNKSEDGEVQSSRSVVPVDYHSTVEDNNVARVIPSLAVIHHDGSSSSSPHVDYDFEKVVHEQNTHDLFCPVCGADVTERIILKKRKRTRVQEDDSRLPKAVMMQPGGRGVDQTPQVDEGDGETWGCLACLSFFIRRGDGVGRVSQALVPGVEEEQIPSVSGKPVETEQEWVGCLPSLFRREHEASEPELQEPLLGDTESEEVVGESLEPPPTNNGLVDDEEEASCFSYLQPPKSSEPMPVSTGDVHEDDRVSCFSYLLSKQRTPVKDASEESSISNLQAEIETEAPNVSEQVEVVREHGDERPDKDQESVIQLLDGIGGSKQRESLEKEKCECLPFFSFRSESFFSLNTVTDTGSPKRDFHPAEDPNTEGNLESLPASVPAFSQGTSSKYDLPPSPGISSPHQEITSVIDRPEEGPTSLTQEPPALGGYTEKISCNCLPDLSWGSIPVYTHPPLDTDESAGIEQLEESTAASFTSSPSQEPGARENAEEKGSCICLSELLPDLSWGPIPVYTHPPAEAYEEPSAGSPIALETQEPQVPEVIEEKASCNCLPEMLPTLSWRSVPLNDTQIQSSPQATTGHWAPKDDDEDVTSSHLKAESENSATCACLPLLLPAFRWRSSWTTYENGLQPLLSQDPPAGGTVPLDNSSTDTMQTTDPVIHGLEEGLAVEPAGQVTTVADQPSLLNDSGETQINIDVAVKWENVTKPESSEKPAEVTNAHQSNYHIEAHMEGGHCTSTVTKLRPEISNGDVVPSRDSQYLSAGTSDEPEGDLTEAVAGHPVTDDVVASPDAETQTVGTVLRDSFPAEEVKQTVDEKPKQEQGPCDCLPLSLPIVRWWRPSTHSTVGGLDDTRTPLLGSASHKPDTVVEIESTETSVVVEGATSAEAAAEAIAIARDQSRSGGERASSEYLKSVVHGGLNVTLVSLGVVASCAGGDAETLTVVAISVANLVLGLRRHLSSIISPQFREEVGERFTHRFLSFISFLFFGALSPIIYGFSFRNATNKNYKFATTSGAALIPLVLLGAASAHVTSKSAVTVISKLIITAILAIIAGYEVAHVIAQLLELCGFSSV